MKNIAKRICSMGIAAALIISSFSVAALAAATDFPDVEGHWAEEIIVELVARDVVAGFPDHTIRPDAIISRGEFATLVARAFSVPAADAGYTPAFSDVHDHWASAQINALTSYAVIPAGEYKSGYAPDSPVTRIEMIRMVVRAMGKEPAAKQNQGDTGFTDNALLSPADRGYVNVAKAYQIIKGYLDGSVRPDIQSTRAEAFTMLFPQYTGGLASEAEKDKGEPSSNGSSGGSVPAPEFSFDLPAQLYCGQPVTLEATGSHLSSVKWMLLQNSAEVPLDQVLEGKLTESGGEITWNIPGDYVLRAVAENRRGRQLVVEKNITVYPLITLSFELPTAAHTDTAIPVQLSAEELGANEVVWALMSGGETVPLEETVEGALDATGGTIRFRTAGSYSLTASVTGINGLVFSCTQSIQIFDVVSLEMTLATTGHTDTAVDIGLEAMHLRDQAVVWTVQKNGEDIDLSECAEGNLSDSGGSLLFRTPGVYRLTASVIDGLGRSYSASEVITIYPVGQAGFYLPEIFHTDDGVLLETSFREVAGNAIEWALTRNGTEVMVEDHVTGALTELGGTLTFPAAGAYVLTAAFKDGGGRTYSYDQSFTVYPVPTAAFTLPAAAHTDTPVEIQVSGTDLENLDLEWLLDNTGGIQDWATFVDGSLNNSGGTIRFKHAGVYSLTARTTDATGRLFLFEEHSKIEVLPVLNLRFELPELAYTGDVIDLRTRGNNGMIPVDWALARNGSPAQLSEFTSGTLNAYGGRIVFLQPGSYLLSAGMTDALGRVFEAEQPIHVMPLIRFSFTLPERIHIGTPLQVIVKDTYNPDQCALIWTIARDGLELNWDEAVQGSLDAQGGSISLKSIGSYTLTAAIQDANGRVFAQSVGIEGANAAPVVSELTLTPTRTYRDGSFLVECQVQASDPDGDPFELQFEGKSENDYYRPGAHTIRVRAVDAFGAASDWVEQTVEIRNSAPNMPVLTVQTTRNAQNGKFLVNISATTPADPDGDAVTLEYQGRSADDRYAPGSHTIRVRAVDHTGMVSEWASKTFEIVSNPPAKPVITRTPSGNAVTPGTVVTIRATSSDPDGDAVQLVWENRPAESHVYPLGRNVIRCKAVDSTGAESAWSAIMFFMADSGGNGGMTLTGPESTILENGLDGATITNFTFTVPPVSGHNGDDYGRVRGYNIKTGSWDQLAYETTNNGVTLSNTMSPGIYSKLEFYYYTNHDCMYNKSNITYSVEYYFD